MNANERELKENISVHSRLKYLKEIICYKASVLLS